MILCIFSRRGGAEKFPAEIQPGMEMIEPVCINL
jgi:hypothetical protein